MKPTYTIHYFQFLREGEGPRAISIEDAYKVWQGREKEISGDLYAVEKVEVTVYFDERAPQVSAYGRRLTKAGKRDRRETTTSLVHMDTEDDERFVRYAQEVMK